MRSNALPILAVFLFAACRAAPASPPVQQHESGKAAIGMGHSAKSAAAAPSSAKPAVLAKPSAPEAVPEPQASAGSPASAPQAVPEPQASAGSPASAPARLMTLDEDTRIWRSPSTQGDRFLGILGVGQAVALRSVDPVQGQGCPGGFFAVEPRGYVCRAGTATLSPPDAFRAVARAVAAEAGPFPYRYALSNGAPMYNRIPSADEQQRAERPFGPAGAFQPLARTLSAHADLATSTPIAPADPILPLLAGGSSMHPDRPGLVRQAIPLGSMLAYTKAFDIEGRAFLLSTDLTLVPADRVRPFRRSEFRGVRLGKEVKLPIAWFRQRPRPRYRRLVSGGMEKTGGSWPEQSFVPLAGGSVQSAGVRYLETTQRDGGEPLYAAAADATVVERLEKIPIGVKKGQKWMIVRITQGTLVAYEELTPVYATLISPGAGGVPMAGQDPVRASTTPLGVYYVTFKNRAATMSPERGENRKFWIADVPHAQYFHPPFAVHASYWHERFGEPTSAGCVNLSPIDAEVLFGWSDPPLPPGWKGVTGAGAPENGPTTAVVIRR